MHRPCGGCRLRVVGCVFHGLGAWVSGKLSVVHVYDASGELFEIMQAMMTDVEDDRPIDSLIGVDGDIAETNGSLHALCEVDGQNSFLIQNVECLAHA